ncbi:MAG: hypothetical protein Q4F65_05600 [Propionibacteriaceae bacterium]|nr:hypothetical protein [Propionibacteriaceae bacterium]
MNGAPQELTQEQLQEILTALEDRGVRGDCPRCGNAQWSLQGHLTTLPLFHPSGTIVLPAPAVPACMVLCVRCGYVSLHALGVLGLMHLAERPTP